MKKYRTSLGMKVAAGILLVCLVVAVIGQFIAGVVMVEYEIYTRDEKSLLEEHYSNITADYALTALQSYVQYLQNGGDAISDKVRDSEDTNFIYEIAWSDESGESVTISQGNLSEIDKDYQRTDLTQQLISSVSKNGKSCYIYGSWYEITQTEGTLEEFNFNNVTITCGPADTLTVKDQYYLVYTLIHAAYVLRYALWVNLALCVILGIAVFVFLMQAAGCRVNENGERYLATGFAERIPMDLYLCLLMVLAGFEMMVLANSYGYGLLVIFGFFLLVDLILGIQFLMSFAIRCKTGNWWENTLLYKCIHGFFGWVGYLFGNLRFVRKAALLVFGICFLEFVGIVVTGYNTRALLSLWFLEKLILVPLLGIIVINMQKLQDAGKKMAELGMEQKINTSHMLPDFKQHGEHLNSMSLGMSRAMEARMKSEHFKTELITNVSHDIKTPLTSIINYVDLLGKEDLENEKVKEYIDVLQRQSTRLKKLIEDLIEASKASTGNLKANMEPCNVSVLLTQTAGEFEEKLQTQNLELILKQPEEEVEILVDGRHLWRVFDNLLNNIYKYAQPGTRVYLNLEKREKDVIITFRNTSKYELNITTEELMERFVRGDSSRHTEGSGLGLSIARSLTELMQGKFAIAVDGDLFKVTLCFPMQ